MLKFKTAHVASMILLATSLFSSPADAEGLKIRMGVEPSYPPFVITNPDGSKTGLEIDLAKEICARAKADCEWSTMDFAGLLPAMVSGKIDLIPENLLPTPERAAKVELTREVVYIPSVLVVPKGWEGGFANKELEGKRIGVIKASAQFKMVTEQVEGAIPVTYEGLDDEALDLRAGRIDAVLAARLSLADKFFKGSDAEDWKFSDREFFVAGLEGKGSVWAVRKGADNILDTVNTTLNAMIADCTYTKIRKKYAPIKMLRDEPENCQ